MIIVKLIVLLMISGVARADSSEYCEVCLNHTLCKYTKLGPSAACLNYDMSAMLTREDIVEIVNRVNEHRNFIALGYSKHLARAANMKKINWSEDLAWSAQRWVDQCNALVHPDKHDQCRDLKDIAVGQNIATILGPSPGLHVKSFIDIWYMRILAYIGSVSYYNKSSDQITNQFTQLIWAETDSIGCGKARFYIETRYVMVERLVCNFAPKGNVHGKPIYVIGFPATQCKEDSVPDEQYIGLCSYKNYINERETSRKISPLPSLLRIINLSNNSIKQEIDPIKKDLNHTVLMGGNGEDHKNKKLRHVFNNSFAPDMSPFLSRPPQWYVFNNSRKFAQLHQHDRGHSRVYHGHDHKRISQPQLTDNNAVILQKYDFTTASHFMNTNGNLRNFNQGNQCTRVVPAVNFSCNTRVPCITNMCTRGYRSDCSITPPCLPNTQVPHVLPHRQCFCSTHRTCGHSISNQYCVTTYPTICPAPNQCYETKYQVHQATSCCPQIARREDKLYNIQDEAQISADLNYYDLFPKIAIRSGDAVSEQPKSAEILDATLSFVMNKPINKEKSQTIIRKRKPYNIYNAPVISGLSQEKDSDKEHYFLYGYSDSSKRFRRESKDQIDSKPFWLVNEDSNAYPLQLKALRYTTINKQYKHAKTSTLSNTVNDFITSNLRNFDRHEDYSIHSTEKYLSFDELMHLRKTNTGYIEARRANTATTKHVVQTTTTKVTTTKAPTTKAPTTTVATPPSNYTVNTPYMRKKFCTRKVTCTWTGLTVTASDGSIINMLTGGGEQGSRTPPGYVEGCTRTSTCTRDYMNRNKISTTLTTEDGTTQLDEDYCERRALNIQRRHSNNEVKSDHNIEYQKIEPDFSSKYSIDSSILEQKERNIYIDLTTEHKHLNVVNTPDPDYVDNIKVTRIKRDLSYNLQKKIYDKQSNSRKRHECKNNLSSYGDLYYLVLSKFLKFRDSTKVSHQYSKCSCNGNSVVQNRYNILTLTLFISWAYFN